MEDFLRQAAGDIVSMLTLTPSTTTPSLHVDDPVRNALLTLATQLNRVQSILEQSSPTNAATSPRVQPTTSPTHIPLPVLLPRV